MIKVHKSIVAVLCVVTAVMMFSIMGCASTAGQDMSTSSDALDTSSEDVSAEENMMKTTTAVIYVKDGTDVAVVEKVVENMTHIEGIVTVGYTDEETAKSRAEHALDEIKDSFVPHAFIEYSVSAEFDIDRVNSEIANIEGLSDIRLDNPTVESVSAEASSKTNAEQSSASSSSASVAGEEVSSSSSASSLVE